MKSVLVSADSTKQAVEGVTSKGGLIGASLANGIFLAVVPPSFSSKDAHLGGGGICAEEPEIDPIEEFLVTSPTLIVDACEQVQGREVSKVADTRPIPLSIKGHIAIAVLVVSGEEDDQQFSDAEISKDIFPAVYTGSLSLAYSYPSLHLSFSYDYHHITIAPSSQVPLVGASKWPSAVSFSNKLYVFYQGNKTKTKSVLYNVLDPTTGTWEGIKQVPYATITDGPSAVVYNDKLWLFHYGTSYSHEVWYNVFDGNKWEGDAQIWNTRITAGPSAIAHGGKLYCFHQGYILNDNELWYNVYDGEKWSGDTLVPDTALTASPSAVSFNGKIYCFYQGIGDFQNSLLVNRLDPDTGEWSGHVEVPYTGPITDGPSAVVFDKKIYVFHLSGTSGEIWFNCSADGSLWRGDTPLTHLTGTDGIGTTVFGDALYMFYQGTGKHIQSLRYRSFAAGTLEWEELWADPALQQLGYHSGYGGFVELAEATRANHGADHAYVACYTKLPLLYNAYADGTRSCVQYPSSDDLPTTLATIFAADGIYDKSSEPAPIPRYTFAHRSALNNTIPISLYSTAFLFHQGKGANSGTQLWFSLLDRRTGKWAEMRGPVTSQTTGGQSGVFLSDDSKLYVFYQVDQNGGEIYYNILDGVAWKGEKMVPSVGASGSPGAVLYKDKMHCFHQGPNTNGTLWVSILNTQTDTWEQDIAVATQPDQYDDDDGKLVFHTQVTLGPSPVVFLDKVYNHYNGTITDKGVLRSNRLRFNVFNGQRATTDQQVVNTYLTGEPSAAVYYDNGLYCFHQGNKTDGTLWCNVCEDGKSWLGDKQMTLENGMSISDGPAAMALEGKLHVIVKGKGEGLDDKLWHIVLQKDADGSGWQQQQQLILPTGAGVESQHDALAIGSLAIDYQTSPPTLGRVI